MHITPIALALAATAVPAFAQQCFESDPPLAAPSDNPLRPDLGDFDADGDLDLATYDAIAYRFTLRHNLGGGNWGAPLSIQTNWDTRASDFVDVDGDGREDLVVVGDLGSLLIHRSLGSSFTGGAFYSVPGNVSELVSGDLDADGDLDLVVASSGFHIGAGMARILRNDGSGNFVVEPGILPDVFDVEIVDFDVDGDPDIAMVDSAPNRFRIAVNDGTGQFPGVPLIVDQPRTVASLLVADFDTDGHEDVAATLVGGGITIQSSTLGGFGGWVEYPTPYPGGDILPGDVDGDGDVDLAVRDGAVVRVLRNAGSGVLALDGTLYEGSTAGGTGGDVDADGDGDFVFLLSPSDQVLILRSCNVSGVPVCFGDGSATACPCGNASPVGARAGCLHSLGTGGTLRASGAASISADSVVLRGASMPNSSVLYFQGTTAANGGLGSVFGDGLRCAAGTVTRLGIATNAGGTSQYPAAGQPPVSVRGAIAAPGERHYQAWYRNAASFCTPDTFNLTNAVRLTWRL